MKKIYSDEEINSLINDVEDNFMLKAPPNLKNDILDKIKKDEEKTKRHKDDVTLTFYSIKVGVTVVAAIVILLITPYLEPKTYINSSKFTDGLGKFTMNIERCIERITPSNEMFKNKDK